MSRLTEKFIKEMAIPRYIISTLSTFIKILHIMLKVASGRSEVPSRLWDTGGGTVRYAVGGGRDVLIVAPGLSLPHLEAVARRPGQLTEEDKLKLKSQELPFESQNEQDIIKLKLDMNWIRSVMQLKSGHVRRVTVSRRSHGKHSTSSKHHTE